MISLSNLQVSLSFVQILLSFLQILYPFLHILLSFLQVFTTTLYPILRRFVTSVAKCLVQKRNCTITRESTGKEKRPKWSSVITALMSQQALMSNDIWKLPIICPVMNVESQLKVQRVSRITKGWSIMQNLVLFADWVLQEVTTWRGTWGHIRISKILRMPQKFRRWKGKRSFVVKLVGSRQREKVIWRDIWGKLTWSG